MSAVFESQENCDQTHVVFPTLATTMPTAMCAATRAAESPELLSSSMGAECVLQRRRSPSDVTETVSAFAANSASSEVAELPKEGGAPVWGETAATGAGWVPLGLRCAQGESVPEPRQWARDALDAAAADPASSCKGHEAPEESAGSAAEPEWVPLSVRQAQAREKLEEEARAKKMAAVVKPVTYDDETGLPCLPTSCLPIKHWNRWREGHRARVAWIKTRDDRSRILANRVMKALKMSASELVYESYCSELARINAADNAPRAAAAGDVPAPAPVQVDDTPAPMLSRSNSFELLAKACAADVDELDAAEPATAPQHCAWARLEKGQGGRELNLNAERGA